jgi:hypothetical protein
MGDVPHHLRQQPAERPLDRWPMERGVAYAGADRELAVRDRQPAERRDAVDVDEVGGPRQPERHGRHQALPARQDASVVRRNLRQNGDRLVDRRRRVIAECCGFHRALAVTVQFGGASTMTAFTSAVNPRPRDNAAEIS